MCSGIETKEHWGCFICALIHSHKLKENYFVIINTWNKFVNELK